LIKFRLFYYIADDFSGEPDFQNVAVYLCKIW